jgi:hypothetical protein
MDSREIVKRAIEFGRPPRLPIGVSDAITQEMFREFAHQMNYWSSGS